MRNGIINDKETQVKGKNSILDVRYWMLAIIILLFITLLRSQILPYRNLAFAPNQQRASFLVEPLLAVTNAGAGWLSPASLPVIFIPPYKTGGPVPDSRPRPGMVFPPSRADGFAHVADHQPERNPPQTADYENCDVVKALAVGGNIAAPLENDWLDELLDRIWMVESSRRLAPPDGDGGKAIGPLQIHADVLLDVNGKYGTKFTVTDLRNLEKAKTIARLYIEMWMDKHKEEIAVRIFNGGPRGWNSETTDGYWKRICDL